MGTMAHCPSTLLGAALWPGASASLAYDNDFRVTSLSVNGANPIALTYDLDSLPIQVGALTLTRNAQNGLITSTALGAITDTTTYDVFGAPATYTVSQNGNPIIYSTTYTRDALGRITSKSETFGGVTHTFAYTYDLASRLTEVRQDDVLTATYGYDPNSNRLSRTDSGGAVTALYDAQDRLTQYGAATYTQTPNGERQEKTTAGEMTTYRYDSLGIPSAESFALPGGMQIDYVLDGASLVLRQASGTARW